MLIENIDEVNPLSFEQYYGEMGITPLQIARRVKVADRFLDAFLLVFAYYKRIKDHANAKTEIPVFLKATLIKALPSEYKEDGKINDIDIQKHIDLVTASVAASILRYGDGWYTDYDSAWSLAADEGNAIENNHDYAEAVQLGIL